MSVRKKQTTTKYMYLVGGRVLFLYVCIHTKEPYGIKNIITPYRTLTPLVVTCRQSRPMTDIPEMRLIYVTAATYKTYGTSNAENKDWGIDIDIDAAKNVYGSTKTIDLSFGQIYENVWH